MYPEFFWGYCFLKIFVVGDQFCFIYCRYLSVLVDFFCVWVPEFGRRYRYTGIKVFHWTKDLGPGTPVPGTQDPGMWEPWDVGTLGCGNPGPGTQKSVPLFFLFLFFSGGGEVGGEVGWGGG